MANGAAASALFSSGDGRGGGGVCGGLQQRARALPAALAVASTTLGHWDTGCNRRRADVPSRAPRPMKARPRVCSAAAPVRAQQDTQLY